MPNIRKLAGDITEDTIAISWNGEDVATLTRRMNDSSETEYVRYKTPAFMTSVMSPMNKEDVLDMLKYYSLPPTADMWDLMIDHKRLCHDNFRVHRI